MDSRFPPGYVPPGTSDFRGNRDPVQTWVEEARTIAVQMDKSVESMFWLIGEGKKDMVAAASAIAVPEISRAIDRLVLQRWPYFLLVLVLGGFVLLGIGGTAGWFFHDWITPSVVCRQNVVQGDMTCRPLQHPA